MTLPRLDGALCVVTGATSGIGKGSALGLARLGAELVLPCRSPERGEATAAEIRARTGATVWVEHCDLSKQASIRDFAQVYLARYRRVDVLVNSAGGLYPGRALTADGLELTLAVNYLGPFLLTRSLLPALEAASVVRAPARIVNVGGEFHRKGRIHFDDLSLERSYSFVGAGAQAVLAKVMFGGELARRLPPGITANTVHPGMVRSGLLRNLPLGLRIVATLARPFMLSEEAGAATGVYLAASPEVREVSGLYFANCAPLEPSEQARDPQACARLWERSEALTGLPELPRRITPSHCE